MICNVIASGPKLVDCLPIGSCPRKTERAKASLTMARFTVAVAVAIGKRAALQQRDRHRAEIVRRADANVRVVTRVASGSVEAASTITSGQWQPADRSDGLHPWQCLKALDYLLIKRILMSGVA